MNENTRVTIGIVASLLLIVSLFGMATSIPNEERNADVGQAIVSSFLCLGSLGTYVLIAAIPEPNKDKRY